jgi:hypothetical protein
MATVKKSDVLPELQPQGKTVTELAKELKAAKVKAKKHEKLMDQQKSLIYKIEVQKLPTLMEGLDQDIINLPGVGKLEYGIEVYASVKVEDKPTLFDWLRDNEAGDLIKEDVHYKTLNSFVTEQLANPEGLKLPEYMNVAKIPTVKLGKELKSKKSKKVNTAPSLCVSIAV